jgi:2-phosphosulfolactate phosphatase
VTRRIDVAVAPAMIATAPRAEVAIAIDVLRATSTIATALANGAGAVVPVREPDEAIAVMRRIGRERVLLCGERRSRLIDGFDLDNSPASYGRDVVAGKTLAFTTTNGTRALIDAARESAAVFCGALVNRAAVARAAHERGAATTLLVCAGNHGTLSFDDLIGAGAIVARLRELDPALACSDAARAAETAFAANERTLTRALATTTHGAHLRDEGFAEDIARCAQLDVIDVVPVYREGAITAA